MSSAYDYADDGEVRGEGEDEGEGEESDDSDSDGSLNVQRVMECLKTYRSFERPIKLRTMIDIVTVLWEDEPM